MRLLERSRVSAKQGVELDSCVSVLQLERCFCEKCEVRSVKRATKTSLTMPEELWRS